MKLYNTLTRARESFAPADGTTVSLYSCGPTVYNFAHIGNMRTYVFMDLLRRALRREGWALNHVMNITDVGHLVSDEDEGEDKMIVGARAQNKTPWEIAAEYTAAFMADMVALNIETPERIVKATEHIQDMIAFVQGLEQKGYAYHTSDGIYFDIGRFAGYGKLSRINLEEQIAGARVEVNAEKRHPADFALWKNAPKEHIMQWDSPWGMGYPGWHIECSAMSLRYLGERFDIHTGGVDHIPVHHENEIAQSEALLGHPAARVWMHGEFMMVDGGKMSKSLNNTYTIGDLRGKGYAPLAFRYFCLNAHYRNKLNFTWEAMDAAQTAYLRMMEGAEAHRQGKDKVAQEVIDAAWQSFMEAVRDDLNFPKALGVAWSLIRIHEKSPSAYDVLLRMDELLGLGIKDARTALDARETGVPEQIQPLLDARALARRNRDWAQSDALRNQIKELGFVIEDTPEGQKLRKA